ncbi:hypothetical protein ACU8KH_02075 [Lachancea thermotolerans]
MPSLAAPAGALDVRGGGDHQNSGSLCTLKAPELDAYHNLTVDGT